MYNHAFVCTYTPVSHAVPTLETVLRTSLKHISFGTMLIECSKNSERVLWSWNCISCLYEGETAIEWINVELLQLLNWMLYIFGTKYGCLLYVCRLKKNTVYKSSAKSLILTEPESLDISTITAADWWITIPCNYMMAGIRLEFCAIKEYNKLISFGDVALCWADFRVGRVLNWIKLY